jgi:hypothetical protein
MTGAPQYNTAGVTAVIDANPAGIDAIVYNLAERMLAYVPKDKGRLAANRVVWLSRKAIETKRVFEASNAPTPNLVMDLITEVSNDAVGAPFNYLVGDYSQ